MKINGIDIESVFHKTSGLAEKISDYEVRDGQIEMASMVGSSFLQDAVCVIEAGTGTGKSFAYLVPSCLWCVEHPDEKIVIATATIHLQHQLFEHDIPLLITQLGLNIRVALVKGRSNYLCFRRLEEEISHALLGGTAKTAELSRLRDWAETTVEGCKSEFSKPPSTELWNRVCSDKDSCIGYKCHHFEDCFLMKARRRASESQIIVTNHHLLFSDISMRAESDDSYDETVILPPFQRLVLDEAHNIERNATAFFTRTYTSKALQSHLFTMKGSRFGRETGLLAKIRPFTPDVAGCELLEDLHVSLRIDMDALDTALEKLLTDSAGNSLLLDGTQKKAFASCKTHVSKLAVSLQQYARNCQRIGESCEELDETIALCLELQAVTAHMLELSDILSAFLEEALWDDTIYWLEKSQTFMGEAVFSLHITPLEISGKLREVLFNAIPTVVCTSATISVNGDFSYWERQVGLLQFNEKRVMRKTFPSPYDYEHRVMLCLPSDAPLPTDFSRYPDYLSHTILSMIEASEGGALILFTSYRSLEQVYGTLVEKLLALGIPALKQGDEERFKLLQRFRKEEKSVLFATESFWEGVDAPGDTLHLVILTKLPFQVPTEPVNLARNRALERAKGNPFFSISLPEAAIKLKQGYGRLMRKPQDRGAVCILDVRLLQKRYGQTLIRALPKSYTVIAPTASVIEHMENFFFS